ncbi:spermidine/putrescine ABC transporter substrate-binding protein, partial [Glutamicibacter arilaitensis]
MTRQRAINDQRQRLLRGIGSAQASRRSVLAGSAGLALAGLLSACGTKSTGTAASAALSPAKDLSDSEKIVNWANWTLYLDYDDETRKYPTLQRFMKESGLEANYVEDIDSNDSYYGKVQSQLSAGQDIGQDLMVLTDWMAERIIRQGYVQDLNHAN